ncbi:AAA family ATPase [Conexibacter woesei]|uniref:AAA family ATPase n=1 Tax=Conexibacter woesei TaxID=191495 RepID=UPI000479AD70|nr:ATP-binding protein [Conexibacter woesei]
MITSLHLESFKNFAEADLDVGPLTLLVGTNASGKSNLRDAFRFLHGVARRYSLAEIIGAKYVEGGVLQWRGIRGGTREVTPPGVDAFAIGVVLGIDDGGRQREAKYRIKVDITDERRGPKVIEERLEVVGRGQYVFDSHPDSNPPNESDALHIAVRLRKRQQAGFVGPQMNFANTTPVLSQLLDHPEVTQTVREHVRLVIQALSSMRFLDLDPDAMREASYPGQIVLGDRGENLSSVLQAITADPAQESVLAEWVRELTPMDAQRFEFVPDAQGRVLLHLTEANGRRISAVSASDGTLRFLAMIAALLGPEPADLYFFEELENGIHPNRLFLLLDLIERSVRRGGRQLVATSHSPQLLGQLSGDALEHASLVYRLEDSATAQIIRVLDLPDARRVLEEQDLARLHAAGWLEDAASFAADEEDVAEDSTRGAAS